METMIYRKLDGNRVKCGICNHYCIIEDNRRGRCQVRENRAGRLMSLVYPKLIASGVDPIEKKPLFHLNPGSFSYSIATVGCNFKCRFCQNSSIAQMPSDNDGMIQGTSVLPEKIVEDAVHAGCRSISFTYTEPTVYIELALDTAEIAKKEGLYTVFVTNGYMSPEVVLKAAPLLDAANVDLKAFTESFYQKYCRASLSPVKKTLLMMKKNGVMVEVTTLLIPGLNDDPEEIKQLTGFIVESLGPETPWHVSRFHPSYRLTQVAPTSIASLEEAVSIGKKSGLRYVYSGNAPGLDSENTYCHSCGALLIRRYGYQIKNYLADRGTCPDCHTSVYGIYQ